MSARRRDRPEDDAARMLRALMIIGAPSAL
jgi:hypothetical protein